MVLGIKLRALCMLSKYSTPELCPQPLQVLMCPVLITMTHTNKSSSSLSTAGKFIYGSEVSSKLICKKNHKKKANRKQTSKLVESECNLALNSQPEKGVLGVEVGENMAVLPSRRDTIIRIRL